MKNSNNCTLDWLYSLDCYSCMTPTAKLTTAPPRNVRENSLSRMRADHSFHRAPDTRHQRGEERMWQYDGSGLTANIARAVAGGAGVEACSACSVYTGQCPRWWAAVSGDPQRSTLWFFHDNEQWESLLSFCQLLTGYWGSIAFNSCSLLYKLLTQISQSRRRHFHI